ncbi:hypothetical protein [Neisseria mucosa]|uniref:hypothetical protein n=1 Tax=Neisseria mucosa TaxID=488 RepID=UPI00280BBA34|nr:hypothetical protein [Neisseria mucosa]
METLQPSQHPVDPQNSVNEPKRLRASEGVSWFTDSWRIFSKNKFKWMGAIILISLIPIAVGFLFGLLGLESPPADFNDFTSPIMIRELLFNLFFYWVGFCFLGGFVLLTAQTAQGKNFNFGSLFAGFSIKKSGAFLILLLLGILVCLPVVILFSIFATGNFLRADFMPAFPILFVILLVFIAIYSMMFWLTPAFIMLEDMKPVAAIKASFNACRRNIPALLVYGLIWLGIGIAFWFIFMTVMLSVSATEASMQQSTVLSIPFLILFFIFLVVTYLILYPVTIIGIYTAYRSIFPQGRLNKY